MTNPSDIERIVMRRVRLIRILTFVISTVMFAALTAAATLWGIGKEVWIARVLQNMPAAGNPEQFIAFWVSAFIHTRLLVQVLLVLTVSSFLFLLAETARFIAGSFVRHWRPN